MDRETFPQNLEKPSLFNEAERLRDQYGETKDLAIALGSFLYEHSHAFPQVYYPQSILESRFTPADEAFEKGMWSCGALVNMATLMLRHVGLQVKLIYGESIDSVDHSWISLCDPKTNVWTEYDLMERDAHVPETNIKKGETDSWDEMKVQIKNDHETRGLRMKERGL